MNRLRVTARTTGQIMKIEVKIQFLMFESIEKNNVDVLNCSFEIARGLISRMFNCSDCGTMNSICRFVKPSNSHQNSHRMSATRLFCHKGKVNVPLWKRLVYSQAFIETFQLGTDFQPNFVHKCRFCTSNEYRNNVNKRE